MESQIASSKIIENDEKMLGLKMKDLCKKSNLKKKSGSRELTSPQNGRGKINLYYFSMQSDI